MAAQETDLAAQAADRVVAAVRTAQAEATQILVATMKQHDVAVAAVRAEAQADLSRAEDRVTELQQDFAERVEADAAARDAALRAAAETARQFDGELVAVRAELEAAEARQVRLEQDFVVRLDTLRREADTARRAQLEAAHVQAAERLEAAVGASQAGAARKLAEAQKKHDVALASVRADAQADATRAESRLAEQQQQLVDRIAGEAELQQQLVDRIAGEEDARVDKLRVAAETAQQHEVAPHVACRSDTEALRHAEAAQCRTGERAGRNARRRISGRRPFGRSSAPADHNPQTGRAGAGGDYTFAGRPAEPAPAGQT